MAAQAQIETIELQGYLVVLEATVTASPLIGLLGKIRHGFVTVFPYRRPGFWRWVGQPSEDRLALAVDAGPEETAPVRPPSTNGRQLFEIQSGRNCPNQP